MAQIETKDGESDTGSDTEERNDEETTKFNAEVHLNLLEHFSNFMEKYFILRVCVLFLTTVRQ